MIWRYKRWLPCHQAVRTVQSPSVPLPVVDLSSFLHTLDHRDAGSARKVPIARLASSWPIGPDHTKSSCDDVNHFILLLAYYIVTSVAWVAPTAASKRPVSPIDEGGSPAIGLKVPVQAADLASSDKARMWRALLSPRPGHPGSWSGANDRRPVQWTGRRRKNQPAGHAGCWCEGTRWSADASSGR